MTIAFTILAAYILYLVLSLTMLFVALYGVPAVFSAASNMMGQAYDATKQGLSSAWDSVSGLWNNEPKSESKIILDEKFIKA